MPELCGTGNRSYHMPEGRHKRCEKREKRSYNYMPESPWCYVLLYIYTPGSMLIISSHFMAPRTRNQSRGRSRTKGNSEYDEQQTHSRSRPQDYRNESPPHVYVPASRFASSQQVRPRPPKWAASPQEISDVRSSILL
jgi:hypothetical protein